MQLEPEFTKVTLEAMKHYRAIQTIRCRLRDLASSFEPFQKDCLTLNKNWDAPNTSFFKTKRGLLLDFFQNSPHRLWTPWGSIEIFVLEGTAPFTARSQLNNELLKSIVTEQYQDRSNRISTMITTYKILAVNYEKLPEPEIDIAIDTTDQPKLNPEDVKKVWAAMELVYRCAVQ